MDRDTAMKFKALFEQEKKNLIYSHSVINSEFIVPEDDLRDEADLTSTEMETSMRIRLRSREALYIKKIDEALKRIQDGSFGQCDDCNEEIELRRLQARPTTALCTSCKEAQETKERSHIDGHRIKSLGRVVRFA